MSTPVTPVPSGPSPAEVVIIQAVASDLRNLFAPLNTNAITNYHNAVAAWLANYQKTTPPLPPPPPISIQQVNVAVLTQDYEAFNAALGLNAADPGSVSLVFSMANSISLAPYPPDPRIAAALTPPPALPQPADPVGISIGGGYFAVVPGDTSPAGYITPAGMDPRGTFVKISYSTPFTQGLAGGVAYAWLQITSTGDLNA